jgi:hypothetical protein
MIYTPKRNLLKQQTPVVIKTKKKRATSRSCCHAPVKFHIRQNDIFFLRNNSLYPSFIGLACVLQFLLLGNFSQLSWKLLCNYCTLQFIICIRESQRQHTYNNQITAG